MTGPASTAMIASLPGPTTRARCVITSVMAVITVADFDGGLAWYERFFGRPADQRPMDGLAEWHLTETGVVQVVYDSNRGGSALLSLAVENLDGIIAELTERRFTVGDLIEGVIGRIASIPDPEDNLITFAQLYGTPEAREHHLQQSLLLRPTRDSFPHWQLRRVS